MENKNTSTIGKKNPIKVSSVMSEMMIEHKWNDLNINDRYRKLQDWRENLEDAMQECVTGMYQGKVRLSCFQTTFKMMKEETRFLVEYASRKNYSMYLSHLAKFDKWMDLVNEDCTAIQNPSPRMTFKEYKGY